MFQEDIDQRLVYYAGTTIVSCVPHGVKANAIYETLQEKINNMVPATMLKQHDDFIISCLL